MRRSDHTAVGYFITEFDEAQFETARRLIGSGLGATGFDVIRSYIFGDALAEPLGGMPTYGGYAIGYHVVQACLNRSGRSIEKRPSCRPTRSLRARASLTER